MRLQYDWYFSKELLNFEVRKSIAKAQHQQSQQVLSLYF